MSQTYFATTTPGLEQPLLDEVRGLKSKRPRVLTGGVEFECTNRAFYRAAYHLRCANGLYLRVDDFRARDFPELYNKTRRYDWERLLVPASPIRVRASATGSALNHTGRIAETVAQAIAERFADDLGQAAPVASDEPGALRILARLDDDRCELSLDAAGQRLYRRGWREHTVAAPIRETTAAALLDLAGWRPDQPLLDPTCGSGTFVIEAALKAMARPAGEHRGFAFHRWANFRPELWAEVVASAAAEVQPVEPRFFGRDVDPDAIAAARHNAATAEAGAAVDLAVADLDALDPPCEAPGLVISNPPYGVRLGHGQDQAPAFERLVERFAAGFDGWRLAVLLPRERAVSHPALSLEVAAEFRNGGIPVRLWIGRHRG